MDLHKSLLDESSDRSSSSNNNNNAGDGVYLGRSEEERATGIRRELRREATHTVLYSLYTVLVYFKPSEAFLVDFLLSKEVVGLESERDLSRSVLAVFTYFRGPALLLCLFLCRYFGCKAVVCLGSLCSLFTTVITVTTKSLWMLQVSQALVSFTFASGIAFDALQFNGIREKKYQLISHFTKGFTLASCCASSFLGQSLREYVGDKFLFTLTLFFELLAFALSFFLPHQKAPTRSDSGPSPTKINHRNNTNNNEPPGIGVPTLLPGVDKRSAGETREGGTDFLLQIQQLEEHQQEEEEEEEEEEEQQQQQQEEHDGKKKKKMKHQNLMMWKEIGTLWQVLKEGEIFRWTVLWTFCYAIHNLVLTNWQVLAQLKLDQSNQVNLNGYALSGGYMMSAVLTLGTSSCKSLYNYRSVVMIGAPLLMGVTLLGMGYGSLLVFYLSFIFFQAVFQVTAAVRNASVAKRVSHVEDDPPLQNGSKMSKVNMTFFLSALLWLASVAGVGFEALMQAGMLYVASLSFADVLVWKCMAALLGIPLVALAVSFKKR